MNVKNNHLVCKALAFIFILFIFQGCIKDKRKITYTANVPIYLSDAELAASTINSEAARPLENPGKIYFKDNYLFINEINKGVHIFDNSIPSSPQNISFITIPGNVDISIKGNVLYADNYVDLVAVDLSDLSHVKLVKRLSKTFPNVYPPTNNNYPRAKIDNNKGIVIGWKVEEITEVFENQGRFSRGKTYNTASATADASGPSAELSAGSTGIAGSMARFIVNGNYLYTVDNSNLSTFDINDPSNPLSLTKTMIGWNIETLFPYGDKLFIGSQTGMFIYSLASPANPTYISRFAHVRSCDPVVVSGNYAYVTLRGGSPCGGFANQLDVIDISNISSPILKKSYAMQEPYGLGVDTNLLFICDGDAGLKAYNINDPMAIDQNMIAHFSGINAYDVIPYKNVLMMIGKNDLYQYDYSDPTQVKLLSSVPIARK